MAIEAVSLFFNGPRSVMCKQKQNEESVLTSDHLTKFGNTTMTKNLYPPVIFFLCFFLEVFVGNEADAETWVDRTGKFKTEADFIKVEGQNVVLKKSNGKIITVELDRLDPTSAAMARELQSQIITKTKPLDSIDSANGAGKTFEKIKAGEFEYWIHEVTIDSMPADTKETAASDRSENRRVTLDLSIRNLTYEMSRISTRSFKLMDADGRLLPTIDEINSFTPEKREKTRRISSQATQVAMDYLMTSQTENQPPNHPPALDQKLQDEEDQVLNVTVLEPHAVIRRQVSFRISRPGIDGALYLEAPKRRQTTLVEQKTAQLRRLGMEPEETVSSLQQSSEARQNGESIKPSGISPAVDTETVRIKIQTGTTEELNRPGLGDELLFNHISLKVVSMERVKSLGEYGPKATVDCEILAIKCELANITKATRKANLLFGLRHQSGVIFKSKTRWQSEYSIQVVPRTTETLTVFFPVPIEEIKGPFSLVVTEREDNVTVQPSSLPPSPPLFADVTLRERAHPTPRTIAVALQGFKAESDIKASSNPSKDRELSRNLPSYFLGDQFLFEDFAHTIHGVKIIDKIAGKYSELKPPEDARFLILECTIENRQRRSERIPSPTLYSLLDSSGHVFKVDNSIIWDLNTRIDSTHNAHPNVPVPFSFPFTIPASASGEDFVLVLEKPAFLLEPSKKLSVKLAAHSGREKIILPSAEQVQLQSNLQPSPASEVEPGELNLNTVISSNNFHYRITGYRSQQTIERRFRMKDIAPKGAIFLLVDFEMENPKSEKQFPEDQLNLIDSRGRVFEKSSLAREHNRILSLDGNERITTSEGFLVPEEVVKGPMVLQIEPSQSPYSEEVPPYHRIRLK